jgi:hypothetical protein
MSSTTSTNMSTTTSTTTPAAAGAGSVIDHSRRVHVEHAAWSVLTIVRDYHPENTGALVLPEGQRQWAWKNKHGIVKQQKLIDSVVYGFPIPSIILNMKSRACYEIYDGRHRIETMWRYFNDKFKWSGKFYSELCAEDQRIFRERTLPTTITQDATNEQLAEIFIRLNSGAALKDYDLFWARRDSALVRATRRLVCNNQRLSTALGNLDLTYRNDLANWIAIVSGLSTWNSGNMTTSYIRQSEGPGLGLEMEIREDRVIDGINALCDLLEAANVTYPVLVKEQKKLKKVGKIIAFFLHEWMAAENRDIVHAKWLDIIGRIRGSDDIAKPMLTALSTTGAQNLTADKISETLAQVASYLAGTPLPVNNRASEDESDDDSE